MHSASIDRNLGAHCTSAVVFILCVPCVECARIHDVRVAPKASLVHNVHKGVDCAHIVHVVLCVAVLNAMLDVGIDTETSQHIHDDDFDA